MAFNSTRLLAQKDMWEPKAKTMTDAQLAAYYCESSHRRKIEIWDDAYYSLMQIMAHEIERRGDGAIAVVKSLVKAGRDAQATAYRVATEELEPTWAGTEYERLV